MSFRVKLGVITVGALGAAFICYYVFRDRSDWDGSYQMSVTERDVAIEAVATFSPNGALYTLQLPLDRQVISVYVVQDTRTAVFGICRVADLGSDSERFYFDPLNEFKIIHMTSDLAWVNIRKAYALGLPRGQGKAIAH